jgi:ParB family chromosome partitioning protein
MTVTETAPPVRTIQQISRIIIGERRNRDVSDVSALAASIAAEGLTHPVILGPGMHLVLGRRRLAACRLLGWTDIPAMTVTGIWQALDYLETEHRDPRHFQPLTVQEAMGMDMVLRGLQWWPKREYGTAGRNTNLGNERRKRIGEALGMNASHYVRARELWQASHGYKESAGTRTPVPDEARDRAAALMAGITARADIGHAYYLYRQYPGDFTRARSGPEGGQAMPVRSTRGDGRRSPQRVQAVQIQQGLASMTGTLAALMHIRTVDSAVPAGQLDDWADEITDMIRDLSTFRRRLNKGQR